VKLFCILELETYFYKDNFVFLSCLHFSDIDAAQNSPVDVKSDIAPKIMDYPNDWIAAMFDFTSVAASTTLGEMSDFSSLENHEERQYLKSINN
jgi:hypothetical protein